MTIPLVPPADVVIAVTDLTRRFGATLALDRLSLEVSRGQVFGLVGANGAGKTTLIKHLLGLYAPLAGSVRVFGLAPTREPARVLGRIGFLSEDRDLPTWMRVEELLRYSAAFYPQWDRAYAEQLRDQFLLDPQARVGRLSRGELAKAGLLVALAHRPDLLILDEPSSGLDPLVRRQMLEAIVRSVAEEGRTVFFSSHLLDEIERVSDHLAMLARGRIVLRGDLAQVLESHHRLTLRFARPLVRPPTLPGALSVAGGGLEWTAVANGALPELTAAAKALGAQVVAEDPATLEEIFLARAATFGATVGPTEG